MRRLRSLIAFAVFAALVIALPGSVAPARAAVLEVGITGCDDVAGAPYCTIGAAILDADALGGDTINIIEDGTYIENVTVDRDVTITGTGMGLTVVDGGGVGRVFDIEAGVSAVITDLDVVNGVATDGGGIQVQAGASLGATSITVSGNSAVAAGFSDGRGGGIYVPSGGELFLNGGSVVTGNTADLFGAGAYLQAESDDSIVIVRTTFDDNDIADKGGGIWLQATCAAACGPRQVLIEKSVFTNNDSQNGGSGIWANADTNNTIEIVDTDFLTNTATCPAFDGGCGDGAGLVIDNGSGDVVVRDSRFHANVADAYGGAITNYGNLALINSIVGSAGNPGPLANRLQSVNAFGGGAIAHLGDTLQITDSAIEGNFSSVGGGGIFTDASTTTIIDGSTIADNVAQGDGGGVYGGGAVQMQFSLVFGNQSGTTAGGAESGLAGYGGGIFARDVFTIDGSSISNNIARGGEGGGVSSFDGGDVTLRSSTVSGNQAITGVAAIGNGGGVSNNGGGSSASMSINSSTIAFNGAVGGAATGGGTFNTDSFAISNTILSSNTSTLAGADNDNCDGTFFNDQGHNLLANLSPVNQECGLTDGVNGNLVGTNVSPVNPNLAPLSFQAFAEGFESYPSGCCVTGSLGPWTITGDMDLLGPAFTGGGLNEFCRSDQCLDLGGSLAAPEQTLSRTVGGLEPGTYQLWFDLAGSQRASSESTEVSVVDSTGTLYSETIVKAPTDRFERVIATFEKPVFGGVSVSFRNLFGADNEGSLLDRIRLIRVDGVNRIDRLSPAAEAASPEPPLGGTTPCEATDQLGNGRLDRCDIGAFEAPYSIQYAIDQSGPGATIVAPDGTFYENIVIGDGKTLEGAAFGVTVIDSTGSGRTVTLDGDATLRRLSIFNGAAIESNGGNVRNPGFDLEIDDVYIRDGFADDGGNIHSTGTLTITGSVIEGGDAFIDGGGVFATGVTNISDSTLVGNGADTNGGAIYVSDSSVTTLNNVSVEANTASAGGGVHVEGGELNVFGGDFTNNSAGDGSAINLDLGPGFIDGTVTINAPTSCTVAPNVASFVPLTSFINNDNTGNGGAIYSYGFLNVHQALFSDNDSRNGGAIYLESGSEAATIGCSAFELNDATDWGGAIGGSDEGFATITDTLFDSNSAGEDGGAINDDEGGIEYVIDRSIFTNNSAANGGAIHSQYDLTVSNSEFSGNQATAAGGAVYWDSFSDHFADLDTLTIDGNTADEGGGLYLDGTERFTVTNSTISNNIATGSDFTAVGGIHARRGAISNTTISGNSAPNGGVGAAYSRESVDLNNVTVTNNSDSIATGGLFTGESQFRISHSIVAGNTSTSGEADCSGFINSYGNNVVGIDSINICGDWLVSDQVGDEVTPIDPMLDSLADNGGPTLTHALLPGSPAINAGATPIRAPLWDPPTLAGYQLNGAAVGDNDELLLAAPNSPVGSAFSTQSVVTDQDFSVEFQFRIDPQPGGEGADGVVVAVSDDVNALGTGGGFLGVGAYDPIDDVIRGAFNGVAVEFDTWGNGAAEGANDAATGDAFNHVGIDLVDIGVGTPLTSVAFGVPDGTLADGSVWTAWVDYDHSNESLEVRASNDGVRPTDALASTSVDLVLQTGAASAFVGFLGATGSAGISGEQRVLSFSFSQFGTCEPFDQRGVLRPIGPACDVGAIEAASPPEVTLNLSSDPFVPTGASTIATIDLPGELAAQPTDPADLSDDNISSAPVANLDTQSTAVEASPVANLPVANLPVANLPAAAQAVLDAVLLVDVPIEGGWDQHLAMSTTGLDGRPIQSVTFGDAMGDPGVVASLDAAGITFNDLSVQSTPIANLTISGLALGDTLVEDLPLDPADNSSVEILTTWCDSIAGQPVDCAALGINPAAGDGGGNTVASMTIAGADISGLPVANIPVANLPVANLPVANLPVANLVLVDSPIANIPVANIPVANLDPGGLPVANLPVANVPVANLDPDGLPVANLPVANLPVANVPVANIPIANLSDPAGT
ncbi:MAG: hypothetical protein HKN91_10140, partial [Acidimicrobiia bacterium]|nr:hypothetical protein [Acidimicrobiia bacterium]